METCAFQPTPFQVTELSLQQEEAFPGPGLVPGLPGPGILFLVQQSILWWPLGQLEPCMGQAWQSPLCWPQTPWHLDQLGDGAGAHTTEELPGELPFPQQQEVKPRIPERATLPSCHHAHSSSASL